MNDNQINDTETKSNEKPPASMVIKKDKKDISSLTEKKIKSTEYKTALRDNLMRRKKIKSSV